MNSISQTFWFTINVILQYTILGVFKYIMSLVVSLWAILYDILLNSNQSEGYIFFWMHLKDREGFDQSSSLLLRSECEVILQTNILRKMLL